MCCNRTKRFFNNFTEFNRAVLDTPVPRDSHKSEGEFQTRNVKALHGSRKTMLVQLPDPLATPIIEATFSTDFWKVCKNKTDLFDMNCLLRHKMPFLHSIHIVERFTYAFRPICSFFQKCIVLQGMKFSGIFYRVIQGIIVSHLVNVTDLDAACKCIMTGLKLTCDTNTMVVSFHSWSFWYIRLNRKVIRKTKRRDSFFNTLSTFPCNTRKCHLAAHVVGFLLDMKGSYIFHWDTAMEKEGVRLKNDIFRLVMYRIALLSSIKIRGAPSVTIYKMMLMQRVWANLRCWG